MCRQLVTAVQMYDKLAKQTSKTASFWLNNVIFCFLCLSGSHAGFYEIHYQHTVHSQR